MNSKYNAQWHVNTAIRGMIATVPDQLMDNIPDLQTTLTILSTLTLQPIQHTNLLLLDQLITRIIISHNKLLDNGKHMC